ncbi:MAG: PEP-CTERM sorting domain-containing protein, partial [Luteolibacter sp.]
AEAPAGEIQWADVNGSNFGSVTSNGVTISIPNQFSGWRVRTFTPDPEAIYDVVRDFVFNDPGTATTITFTGLTANQAYDINFWSFDTGGTNQTSTWSVADGSFVNVDFVGTNAQQTPYLLTSTADETGLMTLSVSGRWRLNGVEISVIPEPSTALLGSLGLLALLRRRR